MEAADACYLDALRACLLGGLTMGPLLLGLSDGYELCRWAGWEAADVAGMTAAVRDCGAGSGCCQGIAGSWLHLHRAVPTWCPPRTLVCRLVQMDAAALAGQHAKWEAPDKFERVTRSECGCIAYVQRVSLPG